MVLIEGQPTQDSHSGGLDGTGMGDIGVEGTGGGDRLEAEARVMVLVLVRVLVLVLVRVRVHVRVRVRVRAAGTGAGVDEQVAADGAGVGDLALADRRASSSGPGLTELVDLVHNAAEVAGPVVMQASRHGQRDG